MIERDYTLLKASELYMALGDDACKWATAFCQFFKKNNPAVTIDRGFVHGWFANAIEHSTDVRRRKD